MARCGCGDQCTCLITEGVGIDVPGSGNVNNPYVVTFDGAEVIGPGIGWSNDQLTARLAPGGGLEFDGTGAMRTTEGGGGGGGEPSGATVAALVAKAKDVIGGSHGAGHMIKPPDLRGTYEYALQTALDMVHVPVRFLSDGTPVVRTADTMLRTLPVQPGAFVQDQDPHHWRAVSDRPGRRLHPDETEGVGRNEPSDGHYGYLEPGQPFGLTTLDDVFRICGRRTVLLLDLRFPPRNAAGDYIDPTPLARVDAFLNRVRAMIGQYGLSTSVLVTTSDIQVRVTQGVIDVLDYFAQLGITVAPTLNTAADAAAHPADATWPAAWTWVFLSADLPRATIDTYVAKTIGSTPLNVMLFHVSRQYLRKTLVNSAAQTAGATGAGALGVLSGDPEYYLGEVYGYRYRSMVPSLNTLTIKEGILPSSGDDIENMPCRRRGFLRGGYNSVFLDHGAIPAAGSVGAWTLMGWACPLISPNSWMMDIGFGYDNFSSYGQLGIAFGVPTDHQFRDPAQSPAPVQADYPLDTGYVLSFDSSGFLWLFAFDRGLRTSMVAAQRPYGVTPLTIGAGGNPDAYRGKPYYFRLGVNENGIKVSTIPAIGGAGTMVYEVKTALAKTFRGSYVYFGRTGMGAWTGFFDQPSFLDTGVPPAGPTP